MGMVGYLISQYCLLLKLSMHVAYENLSKLKIVYAVFGLVCCCKSDLHRFTVVCEVFESKADPA